MTLHAADDTVAERDVRAALGRLDQIWDELFPAEQGRLLQLLVKKAVLLADGLDIHFRSEGLDTVIEELRLIDHGNKDEAA